MSALISNMIVMHYEDYYVLWSLWHWYESLLSLYYFKVFSLLCSPFPILRLLVPHAVAASRFLDFCHLLAPCAPHPWLLPNSLQIHHLVVLFSRYTHNINVHVQYDIGCVEHHHRRYLDYLNQQTRLPLFIEV